MTKLEIVNGIATIPDGETKIERFAFKDCTSIVDIIIPDSVTVIGHGAFYGCTSLKSVTIPMSVMRIADDAFCGCSSLKNIVIPESVIEIGEGAFKNCKSLECITIAGGVKLAEHFYWRDVFEGCDSLKEITFSQDGKEAWCQDRATICSPHQAWHKTHQERCVYG